MRTIVNNVFLLAFLLGSFLMGTECTGQTFYVEQGAYSDEAPRYTKCVEICIGDGDERTDCEQHCSEKFTHVGEVNALVGTGIRQPKPPNPCDTGNCPELMALLERIRVFKDRPVVVRIMNGRETLAVAKTKGSSRTKPLDFKIANKSFQGAATLIVEIEGYGAYEMPVNIGKVDKMRGNLLTPTKLDDKKLKGTLKVPANKTKLRTID